MTNKEIKRAKKLIRVGKILEYICFVIFIIGSSWLMYLLNEKSTNVLSYVIAITLILLSAVVWDFIFRWIYHKEIFIGVRKFSDPPKRLFTNSVDGSHMYNDLHTNATMKNVNIKRVDQ